MNNQLATTEKNILNIPNVLEYSEQNIQYLLNILKITNI